MTLEDEPDLCDDTSSDTTADTATPNKVPTSQKFRPKYKFYDELRDLRKDKYFLLKLRQSPGVKRRQAEKDLESRGDTLIAGANESKA